MKLILSLLFSFTIIICACKTKNSLSHAESTNPDNDIKIALNALSDSVQANGIFGWISFLDSSKEFKWTFMGSTMSYDSLLANFRQKGSGFRFVTLKWDSIQLKRLTENEVTLFTTFTQAGKDPSGEQTAIALDMKADLRLINNSWKFHTCELSEHEQAHTSLGVAEADTSTQLHLVIDSLIKERKGSLYQAAAILDVDDRVSNESYRVYQDMGYILKTPTSN